jgi:phosphohistidine phosphatase
MGNSGDVTERRLVLIRHAKTAAGSPDIDRELTERGRRDAHEIGRRLRALELAPDRVVVSPARRAQETWTLAAAELDSTPEPEIDEHVYDNNVRSLLTIARETVPELGTVFVVGHNPSMHEFAIALDGGTGDADARIAIAAKFPTSGIAVFAVAEWPALTFGGATLLHFDVPRG